MYIPIPLAGSLREPGEHEFRRYLKRIGAGNEFLSGKDCLFHLHQRHLLSVPFENLDIMARRPILLDEPHLYHKIVERQRGGFCYELNGLFAWMLRCYGFQVEILSARVVARNDADRGRDEVAYRRGKPGPEFDHLLLMVTIEGQRYLADVGFGGLFVQPLLFQTDEEYSDRLGRLRITEPSSGQFSVQRFVYDHWLDIYLFSLKNHSIEEFADMCRHHSTSPGSHFTQGRRVQMVTEEGRASLINDSLRIVRNGNAREKVLTREQQVHYLEHLFGFIPSEIAAIYNQTL